MKFNEIYIVFDRNGNVRAGQVSEADARLELVIRYAADMDTVVVDFDDMVELTKSAKVAGWTVKRYYLAEVVDAGLEHLGHLVANLGLLDQGAEKENGE